MIMVVLWFKLVSFFGGPAWFLFWISIRFGQLFSGSLIYTLPWFMMIDECYDKLTYPSTKNTTSLTFIGFVRAGTGTFW